VSPVSEKVSTLVFSTENIFLTNLMFKASNVPAISGLFTKSIFFKNLAKHSFLNNVAY
jgi:hypothetical protein